MFDNRCDTIFSGRYCGTFGVRELRSRFSFLYEPERASTNVRVLSAARLDCHPERSEGSQLTLARRMNSSVDPLYKKSSIQLSPLDATLISISSQTPMNMQLSIQYKRLMCYRAYHSVPVRTTDLQKFCIFW